jgi:hypothetical protein
MTRIEAREKVYEDKKHFRYLLDSVQKVAYFEAVIIFSEMNDGNCNASN